jgi:anti-sigma regulatory factor (Ser/Thr protein kinase)
VRFQTLLAPDAAAGARARGTRDDWLADALSERARGAVELGASELVTNAVRYGGLSPDDQIVLVVELEDEVVRVDVEQRGSAEAATVVDGAGIQREGGFGLLLVAAICERWGVTGGSPGHVWFEVARYG